MRVRIASRVLLALGVAAIAAPLTAAPETSEGHPATLSVASLMGTEGVANQPSLGGVVADRATTRALSNTKATPPRGSAEATTALARSPSRCHVALPCARTTQGYDEPIQFRRSDPAFH